MALIDLDISHTYNPGRPERAYALLPQKISFKDGGAYALLGPSGCGKTTLLNIISGLITPSEGSVKIDDRDVTSLTPQQRNIAQVFQFPVIYDTMTVAENLAFPLKNRRMPDKIIRQRVGEIAEMLELSPYLNQAATGLSAEQQQRISLGRGLVRPDVAAVLLDEPLTVIDPHLKFQLRRKLKQIHQELKLTFIYVTHDQVEALTFAEEIVVMSQSKAIQIGSAQRLFERPEHTFVGYFIGSPGMNFLPANFSAEGLDIAGYRLACPTTYRLPLGALKFGIRPEYAIFLPADAPGALPVKITRVQDLGTHRLVTATFDTHVLKIRVMADRLLPQPGEMAWLNVLNEHSCFYQNERLVV